MSLPSTEHMSPAEQAEFARLWDQLIQFLLSLGDEDRAAALADPGALLERCGLGDVDGPTLQSAIEHSESYARETERDGGRHHDSPPPPDPHPHHGESSEDAAERVRNYYVHNSYSEIVDQSTNIDGDVYGDVTTRNVNGDGNQVSDHSSFGDNIHGDGVVTGNGNNVVGGDGNDVAFGHGSAAGGAGNVVGNSGVVGHDNTTGFGSGSTSSGDTSVDSSQHDSGNTHVDTSVHDSGNTDQSTHDASHTVIDPTP